MTSQYHNINANSNMQFFIATIRSKVIVTTGTIAETSCRKTANTFGFSGKVFATSVPWKQLRLVGYNNEPFL